MKSLRTLSPAGFLVLALLAPSLSTGTASGQDSKGQLSSWDNLKSLTPGQEIRVVMNSVKSYRGEFGSWSGDGITLRQAEGEQTLARKDILHVSRQVGRNHQGRNFLIGTAVGAGSGLVIGTAVNNYIWNHVNCTEGPLFFCAGPPNPHWGLILTPVGGLVGSIIGAAAPTGGWHDLYRAH